MNLLDGNGQRKIILEATLRTIAAEKISGTRMHLIAEKAGMSQGNLHYYFPTKTELFVALLDAMLDTFASERSDELKDRRLSPRQKLRCIFDQKKAFLRQRRAFMDAYYDFWVQATKDPVIRTKMQEQYTIWRHDVHEVVQEGVDLGEFDPRQAGLAPSLIISLMEGAALQYLIEPAVFDLDEYFSVALNMTLCILGAPEMDHVEVGDDTG